MNPIRATHTSAPTARPSVPEEQRLREVVTQLEGVFVEQLFKAMRETVPTDGLTSGGSGEEMFRGMLDQHLASAVPGQWHSGLGRSLLEQLRPALQSSDSTSLPPKGTK